MIKSSSNPIWNNLPLISHLALLNMKTKFKGTFLGIIWSALEPLMIFLLLFTVFTNFRMAPNEGFAIYLLTGILFFHIFSRGTLFGMVSLSSNANLLQSFSIKRSFFPLSTTISSAISTTVEVIVFVSLLPVLGFSPSWTILLLPIPLFLVLVLVLGLSYLLSIIHVFFRDIQVIWSVLIQALFFITPIFWNLDDVHGILHDIQIINPLSQILTLSHKIVFGINPTLIEWTYAFLITFGILCLGYIVFHKYQNNFIEEL